MSSEMLPGLTEGIKDSWNWLTGKPQPVEDVVEEDSDENDLPDTNPIAVAPTPIRRGVSLEEELFFLHLDALGAFGKRVTDPYFKAQEARKKIAPLNELLQDIAANSDAKGNYKATSKDQKALLKTAQELGVKVPGKDKENFTRDDTQSLISNLKTVTGSLDVDMKMGLNDATQAMSERNTLYAELNTLHKNRRDACQAISRGIAGRS